MAIPSLFKSFKMHPLLDNQLLKQKLITLVGALFWPLFSLFRFITSYFFRYTISGEYDAKEFDFVDASSEPEEDELKKEYDEDGDSKNEAKMICTSDSLNEEKKDKHEMGFAFKFPIYEESITNTKENDVFNHFVVEADFADDKVSIFSEFHSEIDLKKEEILSSGVNQFTEGDSFEYKNAFLKEYLSYIAMKIEQNDNDISEVNVEIENHDSKLVLDEGDTQKHVEEEQKNVGFSSEGSCYSEKDSLFTGSDTDSTSFEQVRSVMSFLIDSYSECFLSDDDFGEEPEPFYENPIYIDGKNIEFHADEMAEEEKNCESEELDDEKEKENREEGDELNSGFLTEKDFDENSNHSKGNSEKDGGSSSKESSDGNKMEYLWEHQDLIEQLKMELKKVRATGLPTILEESESPKIMDDLKPWKIEEKFHHQDFLGELHKVYKTYYGRMRKFDILTYQKMYTIGFLHLKDPFQSTSNEKSSSPTFKSLLSQNYWVLKNRSLDSSRDPMMKFIKDLQSDFEAVYVGQMCLSWEFLHWEYLKALDLCESDPHGIRRYNEVADEFQQFQVLIQRFLEDEKFQGPRVQYFIKTRRVLLNLLHVPVIREDSVKDKRKTRTIGSREYIITSEMLVDILEESIRTFCRFIQADKDCSSAAFRKKKGLSVQLQNPEDHGLLMEISNSLQKKKRKLKEILRGRSCILRRFKKSSVGEEDFDAGLYFFSQVDMKLVSRALNMSKITTEQLNWCRHKLNGKNFVGRKMHVEGSFLLFPY